MIDRELFKDPKIKSITIKLVWLTLVQAFLLLFQAISLTNSLVKVWHGDPLRSIIVPVSFFVAAFVLKNVIINYKQKLLNDFSLDYTKSLKTELFHAQYEIGSLNNSGEGAGNFARLGIDGVNQVETYLNLVLDKVINLQIIPVVLLIYIFTQNPTGGLVLLLTIPLIILFMIILGLTAKKMADQQYASFKLLANHFVDSLRGIRTLRVFGLSDKYDKNIYEVSEHYRKETVKTLRIAFLSSFALSFLTTIAIAILAVFLGIGLMKGHYQLFNAMVVLILAPDYFLPLRQFGSDYHATLNGKVSLEEINKIINRAPDESADTLTNFERWSEDDKLEVKNLSFDINNERILHDINFAVKGFKKIGIVGETGSGKTTLLNTISGFLTPDSLETNFKLNQQDLSSMNQVAWHNASMYLPQHPYIFSGSLLDNLKFYTPNASANAIDQVIKQVELTSLVSELPSGLDTKIGPGGRPVSGGQAQRIALARVLLDEKRDILFLDEPTAHLDVETEFSLKKSMLPVLENRLVFFATHRLHWMKEMDWVLVVDHGQIVEQGRPNDLMTEKGYFTDLVTKLQGEIL